MDSALGLAVNGVPIYDYMAGGEIQMDASGNSTYDARLDTVVLGQLDSCGGHSGKWDDDHYHKRPDCMVDAMDNRDSNPIIVWAYDGYPIYDYQDNQSDLGPCNEIEDETFGYRYHATVSHPYIVKCLLGEVNVQGLPRVSPFREGGTPISVTNLGYNTIANADGTETRALSYTYKSIEYYIKYSTRTDSDRCFDVDAKMCKANQDNCNTVEQNGCYCREMAGGEQAPGGCQSAGGGGTPPP